MTTLEISLTTFIAGFLAAKAYRKYGGEYKCIGEVKFQWNIDNKMKKIYTALFLENKFGHRKVLVPKSDYANNMEHSYVQELTHKWIKCGFPANDMPFTVRYSNPKVASPTRLKVIKGGKK